MGKHNTEVGIKNPKELYKQLQRLPEQSEKAIEATVKDFKSRAPSWVSKEVRQMYGIQTQDLKPNTITSRKVQGTNRKPGQARLAGRIFTKGKTIGELRIVYTGRVLTPVHFSMAPKAPRPAYTLKTKIRQERKTMGQVKRLTKKQKENVGRNFKHKSVKRSRRSPVMLIHTGNVKAGGIDYIPMRRVSEKRDDLIAIKTVALPEMVDNPIVRTGIDKTIQENMSKRLDHNMNRFLK